MSVTFDAAVGAVSHLVMVVLFEADSDAVVLLLIIILLLVQEAAKIVLEAIAQTDSLIRSVRLCSVSLNHVISHSNSPEVEDPTL